MQEIIKAQGGNPDIDSEDLKPGKYSYSPTAPKESKVKNISIKNLTIIAKILGSPNQKGSGIFLDKKIGEKANKGDILYTIYSENESDLQEAKHTLINFPILELV